MNLRISLLVVLFALLFKGISQSNFNVRRTNQMMTINEIISSEYPLKPDKASEEKLDY